MKLLQTALNIGSIALIAVLGWLAVRSFIGVTNPQSLYVADPIMTPSETAQTAREARIYDFSTDPFSFGETSIVAETPIEDAPETTLNLKLKGIVSESSATFRLENGKDKPVAIGEDVLDGVALTRTAKDFVMLDVNGDLQRLTLERVKLEEQAGTKAIVRAAVQNSDLPNRAELEKFFSQVQLIPQTEILPDKTTRPQGFKIRARSGANLSKYGLKSGDIVTRIGPVLLTSNRTNMKELRDLISTGAAQDIEVLRGGKAVTIRIGQ